MSETPAEYQVTYPSENSAQIEHEAAGVIVYCARYPTRGENLKAAVEALERELAHVQH